MLGMCSWSQWRVEKGGKNRHRNTCQQNVNGIPHYCHELKTQHEIKPLRPLRMHQPQLHAARPTWEGGAASEGGV